MRAPGWRSWRGTFRSPRARRLGLRRGSRASSGAKSTAAAHGEAPRSPWGGPRAHRPPRRCRNRCRSRPGLVRVERGPVRANRLLELVTVAAGTVHRPEPEALLQPIGSGGAQRGDGLAQERRARATGLRGKAVEPGDVVLGKVG